MNGFRHELLDKIVGINGHIFLQGDRDARSPTTTPWMKRVAAVPGVRSW